ncbi:fumarylacetoacetate hydrolase family protein [Sediminibacterium soli]|uniref:fumarylacetoacetate hydrolase family protein n=1 Tax=Sediminibacterium soli TaxID=2698829 RepID=UPI00137B65C2|nr:fumarylacetoacetate hydrolase family protein [Sediminibacterium soli]NCI45746.1 2-hydroxyhepta-2,4-diene-1,7-dioate isomerase [Sediminibacterium soli]
MKLYKTSEAIVIEKDNAYYHTTGDWESFVNDDQLFDKAAQLIAYGQAENSLRGKILAPLGEHQEVWACGVTYLRSKIGRQEESKAAGGSDFYARVYDAERPEVFFKATPHRVVAQHEKLAIRKDSTWDVPEPELTLVVTSSGKIVGYTIGNDMSSRSIEGENPLYLPQAKTYDACAAIGPCIYLTDQSFDHAAIGLEILRGKQMVFEGSIDIDQMKRKPAELVSFVYRACSFPYGCLVMTGTGIVPGNDFTLRTGDEIRITIEHIGTLINTVG